MWLNIIRSVFDVMIIMFFMNDLLVEAQPPADPKFAAAPRFEVASIRRCRQEDTPRNRITGGPGSGRVTVGPGRIRLECQTVESLIQWAFIGHASGKDWPLEPQTGSRTPPVSYRLIYQPILGGPAWIRSERYTIEAKASNAQTFAMMRGPMMQTLLEDRLQLKIHRQMKQSPIYRLVVTPNGPKLQSSTDKSCVPFDVTRGEHAPLGAASPPCGFVRFKTGSIEIYGQTMAAACRQFSNWLDRDVIDGTDLPGVFDFHLELNPAEVLKSAKMERPTEPSDTPIPAAGTDPFGALNNALRRLGLKLEAARSSVEVVAIDRIERPSEN